MTFKKIFVLISFSALIYSCGLVKSTTYKNIYGDPQSEDYNKCVQSIPALTNEKILFSHIADLTMNTDSIKDFEMAKMNPFSANQSLHGTVLLSRYDLNFI